MADEPKLKNKFGEPLTDKGQWLPGVTYTGDWREEYTARRRARSEELKGQFLNEYALVPNISRSATKVGVTRKTVGVWRQEDKDFREAFNELQQMHIDDAEQAMFERARLPGKEGTLAGAIILNAHRSKVYKGNGQNNGGSNTTINFIMGAPPPELAEPQTRRLSVQSGKEITIDADEDRDE